MVELIENKWHEQGAIVLTEILKQKQREKPMVTLGVPGGRSIPPLLRDLSYKDLIWDKIHVFLMDERMVPLDHPLSNFTQISPNLHQVPKSNLHPFIYDPTEKDNGISHYQQTFDQYGGSFDVVVVSSGEDGHIASLFPNHSSIQNDSPGFIQVKNAPKPPSKRMSCSKTLLLQSSVGMVLFCGMQKKQSFQWYHDETLTVTQCPAKLIAQLPKSIVVTDF